MNASKKDVNQTVSKAVRKALGIGKMNGESMLGSADLKRQGGLILTARAGCT